MRRIPLLVALATIWLGVSGCSYMEERQADLMDSFYFSAGRAAGISVDASFAPVALVLGAHSANVYGWEGRRAIHRKEIAQGVGIGFVSQMEELATYDSSPLFEPITHSRPSFPMPFDPNYPEPFVYRSYLCTSIPFAEFVEPVEVDATPVHSTPVGRATFAQWGIGLGATPVIFNFRFGIRPLGFANFLTGWADVHLFPPFEAGTNRISLEARRQRGIAMELEGEALRDQLLEDLESHDPYIALHAIKMLGFMPGLDGEGRAALERKSRDPLIVHRLAAILALGRVDPARHPAAPALRRELDSYRGEYREHLEVLLKYAERIETARAANQ